MTERESKILRPKRAARRAAELARRAAAENPAAVRKAFRDAGFTISEHDPDQHYVNRYYGHQAGKLHAGMQDEDFLALARDALDRTFLYYDRLYTLYKAVVDVARRFPTVELAVLEAGVYRGGSALFLARCLDRCSSGGARLVAIDTFAGHSEADLVDGTEGVHDTTKFTDVSVDDVREYLDPFSFVTVVEGRLQDRAYSIPPTLHLFHLDVDLYAPTRFGLELAVDRLVDGGIVVVDDYGTETCPGIVRAVAEFADEHGDRFVIHPLDTGQCLVIRAG